MLEGEYIFFSYEIEHVTQYNFLKLISFENRPISGNLMHEHYFIKETTDLRTRGLHTVLKIERGRIENVTSYGGSTITTIIKLKKCMAHHFVAVLLRGLVNSTVPGCSFCLGG